MRYKLVKIESTPRKTKDCAANMEHFSLTIYKIFIVLRLDCSGSCCWRYQCGGCGGCGGRGGGCCDCGSVGGVGLNLYIVSLMKLLSYHLIT